ncbi:MAG: hypothetical protein J7K98_03830 [Candidatus Aenigmarchaeota archaeon]|nr:hypothetical protein [Candidatus Aenigmarchaeota archaeon]
MGSIPRMVVWKPNVSFGSWSLGHPLTSVVFTFLLFAIAVYVYWSVFKSPRKRPEEF